MQRSATEKPSEQFLPEAPRFVPRRSPSPPRLVLRRLPGAPRLVPCRSPSAPVPCLVPLWSPGLVPAVWSRLVTRRALRLIPCRSSSAPVLFLVPLLSPSALVLVPAAPTLSPFRIAIVSPRLKATAEPRSLERRSATRLRSPTPARSLERRSATRLRSPTPAVPKLLRQQRQLRLSWSPATGLVPAAWSRLVLRWSPTARWRRRAPTA